MAGVSEPAHHLIAHLEFGDPRTHLIDHTGDIGPQARGQRQRDHLAHEAPHDLPVDGIDTGGPHLDPDLPGPGGQRGRIDRSEHIRAAVFRELHCSRHLYISNLIRIE